MPRATTTSTRATVRLKLAILVFAVLSGAIILNRCVTLGGLGNTNNSNGNKNTSQSCIETSCDGGMVSIDVEGATLTLTALSAKDKIIGKLKCPQGDLVCEGSVDTATGVYDCCRQSIYTISSFTFTTEGPGGCTGGGGSSGGNNSIPSSCSSKEDGVTKALTSLGSTIDQAKCLNAAGKESCGYMVTGSGTITVTECPTCDAKYDIKWTKKCQAAEVEGFWDKYRIQVSGSMSQSCAYSDTPK